MKRFTALILALLMTISFAIAVGAVNENTVNSTFKGDVNQSGAIDMMDYVLTKRAYFGTFTLSEAQSEIVDVNDSGDLDMMDYVLIKRMYFGTYPVPQMPESGSDNSNSSDNTDISSGSDNTENPGGTDNSDSSEDSGFSDGSDNTDSGEDDENSVISREGVVSIGKTYTYSNTVYTNDVGLVGTKPDTCLTDGEKEHNKYYDVQYVGFNTANGQTVDIIIDLGAEYYTNKFVGYTYGGGLDGIENPDSLIVEISTDNQTWTVVGDGVATTTNVVDDWQNEGVIASYTVSSSAPLVARYVKFSFVASCEYVMLDELEVYGTTGDSNDGSQTTPDSGNDNTTVNTTGEDILLCYISESGRDISISANTFLPAVGYTVNGQVQDYMFDSFIFLCQPNYLYDWDSDGVAYLKPFTKSDWSNYILNEELKSGKNINALNDAVGQVKAQLGDTDYKAKVYMTLFYPVETVTNFGVVDGKNLNFTNLEDRKLGIKWMVDESVRQFEAKNYENIELAGFYWFCEEIYEESGAGREIAKYVTDYIRTLNMKTTWCPYFYANGYTDWQELGFDIATMQANYFPERKGWPNSGGAERLPLVAQAVRRYGIGVGMEMADVEQTDSAEIFKEYMEAGVNYDFMNSNHIYYMSTGPDIVSSLCNSSNTTFRTTYDELYKFIHGTLKTSDITK